MPESVPTEHMLFKRYALTRDSFVFHVGPRKKIGNYTLADTAGCSCEQLVDVAEANSVKALSSDNIIMSDLLIRNTSVVDTRASVLVQCILTQTTEVTVPIEYHRTFEAAIPLFPDDIASTQCGCTSPVCSSGVYQRQYCESETYADADVFLPC